MDTKQFFDQLNIAKWREHTGKLEDIVVSYGKEIESWPYTHQVQVLKDHRIIDIMRIRAFVQAQADMIVKVQEAYIDPDQHLEIDGFFIVELLEWIALIKFPEDTIKRGMTTGISAVDMDENVIELLGFTINYMQGVTAVIELVEGQLTN